MDYADRIRHLREDNDYTQKFMADLLYVGQKTYSDYEVRRIRLPIDSLIILAKFYDVDMNYICGLTEEKKVFPK